jgi:Asp-tRNA(Asn)/Glu-tRNA(Gln) amidotransferase A subunit family amidase
MRYPKFVLKGALIVWTSIVFAPAGRAGPVDVVELSASQIEADLAAGKYSTHALVQAYLDRINQFNINYNAFTYLNPADALAQADAIDAQIAANGVTKPLEGVPIVIKDSMNVAGVRTTSGFFGFAHEYSDSITGQVGVDMIAKADAPIVARLRAAGAVILGKTNLPSFARSGANANTSFFGPTYNAVVHDRAPGGSSSGTATATSASFATMGTAEETGGSIQNPSGAQALVGIKTTFGLVPTSGGVPLSGSTRDVFGTNAKSVRDAANMLSVIAGYDPSDPNTAQSTVASGHIPAAGYAAGLSTTSLQGKRFGLYSSAPTGPTGAFKNTTLSADAAALYTSAQNVLRAQGATLVPDVFTGTNFSTLAATFSQWGSTNLPYEINQWMKDTLDPAKSPTSVAAFKAATHGIDLYQPSGPLIGSFTPTASNPDAPLALQANTLTPDVSDTASVQKFMDGRAIMLAAFRKVMSDNNLDGLFFPQQSAEPGLMPNAGGTGSYSAVTVSEINLLGTPQVNLPGGYYADGTPFSVAFLGDQWSETSLLSYAYDFEDATHYRVAPTLAVPEPATGAVMLVGFTMTLVRRRRGR